MASVEARNGSHMQEIGRLAHDLSCVNGIELGGGLDALNALLDINADWTGGDVAPIGPQRFIALLECARLKMQEAKDTMEGLISDLETAVAHVG
jgi:hypothetical protein